MADDNDLSALQNLSDDDRDRLIRTAYGEANGQPDAGIAGVFHVINNRAQAEGFPDKAVDVVNQPKQFSLWNDGDPAGVAANQLSTASPAYDHIGDILDDVADGTIADPTNGATHYYNPKLASPAWGDKLAAANDVTIGDHRFVGDANSGGPGDYVSASAAPATGRSSAVDPTGGQGALSGNFIAQDPGIFRIGGYAPSGGSWDRHAP